MSKKRELPLVRGSITLSEAKISDANVIHQLGLVPQRDAYLSSVDGRRHELEQLVGHHLGITAARCRAAHRAEWMSGSYNLCVPVAADQRRVIVRLPLPYKNGERFFPGNCDEKVRCEAGAYAWLSENCPDIPVPRYYGFGLSTQQAFTACEHLPWPRRVVERLRRWFRALVDRETPSLFVPHRRNSASTLGAYLVMDYVDGEMLSNTWTGHHTACEQRRQNLYRGLAKILLTLSRVPQPTIGSFIIQDDGCLHLANRPLTLACAELENEGIATKIPRHRTFCSTNDYVQALLSCHESRLLQKPNAIYSEVRGMQCMSALLVMRAMSPQFFDEGLNYGPFAVSFTDLHASNIMVDNEWNIRWIIDLEWMSSLPLEFQQPPDWLTATEFVNHIDPEAYNEARTEFMKCLEDQERQAGPSRLGDAHQSLLELMNSCWRRSTFWFWLALTCYNGAASLTFERIATEYIHMPDDKMAIFVIALSDFFCRGAGELRQRKLAEDAEYEVELERLFVNEFRT